MPLFICDECSGIENTALGTSFLKSTGKFYGLLVKDHSKVTALCSECTPPERAHRRPPLTWHGEFPKVIATEQMVRECGLWPHPLTGTHSGFMHLGKFEHLRPQLERQRRNAARRLKRKKSRGDP